MPVLTDVKGTAELVKSQAGTIVTDFALIAVGDFVGEWVGAKVRLQGILSGLVLAGVGIIGAVMADQRGSRYLRSLAIGVGVSGVRKILSDIIP